MYALGIYTATTATIFLAPFLLILASLGGFLPHLACVFDVVVGSFSACDPLAVDPGVINVREGCQRPSIHSIWYRLWLLTIGLHYPGQKIYFIDEDLAADSDDGTSFDEAVTRDGAFAAMARGCLESQVPNAGLGEGRVAAAKLLNGKKRQGRELRGSRRVCCGKFAAGFHRNVHRIVFRSGMIGNWTTGTLWLK